LVGVEAFAQAVHKQLVDDGLIEMDEHGYWKLTEKGKKLVEKELDRYLLRPGTLQMIGMHFAERMGVNLKV
jgi:Mn-dependent DtxR family transcriptional regulator